MKMIETQNAVGHILCHDLTRIVRGEMKGPQFKKGHVVTEEDIPMLLSMGKDHLYVWVLEEGMLHENDAAARLAKILAGPGMRLSEPSEGKIDLFAEFDGLFRVDAERLNRINSIESVMAATRHDLFPVCMGDKLCGTRVIPLVIEEEKIREAERAAGDVPVLSLLPYRPIVAGIVTTGNEVFTGRIQDTFTPVVVEKLKIYGIEARYFERSDDSKENIVKAIEKVRAQGAGLVICTGGMSVDPDDRTPAAIRQSGALVVSYGAPVLPGAMFLLGYYGDGTPVMGLPACVMYADATIFDIILPRIASGLRVEKKDIAHLGPGGLCLNCKPCRYPNCSFGKFA
jgi:hypothetical protein